MSSDLDLKLKKKKAFFTKRMTGTILLIELFLNAAIYFALKSNNQPIAAILMALIVLGYLGLTWQK